MEMSTPVILLLLIYLLSIVLPNIPAILIYMMFPSPKSAVPVISADLNGIISLQSDPSEYHSQNIKNDFFRIIPKSVIRTSGFNLSDRITKK